MVRDGSWGKIHAMKKRWKREEVETTSTASQGVDPEAHIKFPYSKRSTWGYGGIDGPI